MGGTGSGGRNRKSAARKKLEGNAGKRKAGKRKKKSRTRGAQQPASLQYSGPLGPAPAHLKPVQKKVWNELSSIVPIGTVEASDRWAFELLVCLMAKFRRGAAKAGEVSQISSHLARFGMTPADRERVNPSRPLLPKSDPWQKFAPARSQ
jgi:hypothetical protein